MTGSPPLERRLPVDRARRRRPARTATRDRPGSPRGRLDARRRRPRRDRPRARAAGPRVGLGHGRRCSPSACPSCSSTATSPSDVQQGPRPPSRSSSSTWRCACLSAGGAATTTSTRTSTGGEQHSHAHAARATGTRGAVPRRLRHRPRPRHGRERGRRHPPRRLVESTALAVSSLALLAVFTAVSMDDPGFGLTLVSRPCDARRPAGRRGVRGWAPARSVLLGASLAFGFESLVRGGPRPGASHPSAEPARGDAYDRGRPCPHEPSPLRP